MATIDDSSAHGDGNVRLPDIEVESKSLSENRDLGEDELSTGQMKESKIILHLLFPPNEETTRAIEPGMGPFNDPATLPPNAVFCF